MAVSKAELGKLFRDSMAKTQETEEQEEQQTETETGEAVDTEDASDVEETKTQETEEEETETEEDETEVETDSDKPREVEVEDGLSLTDLAKSLEVEPEFLYSIKIPMPDGIEPMTLSELKDSYNRVRNESDESKAAIEKERADFIAYRDQELEMLQQHMQLPQEIMAARSQAMAIAYNYENFDWDSLEKEDPGRAALEKQRIASAFQNAQQKATELERKYAEKVQGDVKKFQQGEYNNMLKFIPEWKNDETRIQEQGQMRAMLKEYGYNDRDINMLSDHRAMRITRDLWKMKTGQKKAAEAVKRVIKLPKTVRAGGKPPGLSKAKKTAQGIKQAKEARSDREKASAIGKLLRNEL